MHRHFEEAFLKIAEISQSMLHPLQAFGSWETMNQMSEATYQTCFWCPLVQVALQQSECYAVRAAALQFVAVAMSMSSACTAKEAHEPRSPSLPDSNRSSPRGMLSSEQELPSDLSDTHDIDGLSLDDMPVPRGRITRTALAGPLRLQSDFALQYYTQDIWDFGIEQLLLQGSFWEQMPALLQVGVLIVVTGMGQLHEISDHVLCT